MNARVESTHDDGSPETFRDEHGNRWRTAIHNTDGTIAVEQINDFGGGSSIPAISDYESHQAGVFCWGTGDEGEIYPKQDGDFYGVNCSEEFVAKDGQWVENTVEA